MQVAYVGTFVTVAVNGAGPADSRDSQKGGAQNALVVGPSLQSKGQ